MVAAQSDEPTSWMVEILQAKAAYRANVAAEKAAQSMAKSTIDLIG
jgi:flagellar basal body rod protein FlgC